MKLIDALRIAQRPATDGAPRLCVFLACDFPPLHLQTFKAAHLRFRRPEIRPEVGTRLFRDLGGHAERLNSSKIDSLALGLEWTDLNPRLRT
jgi:hypothetical protein